MSAHYTRDFVWVVVTSIDSLGSIPYTAPRAPGRYSFLDLGIDGVYLNAADPKATSLKRQEGLLKGFKIGRFYPASTEFQFGAQVAKAINDDRLKFCPNDNGQTPYLLDFEPSHGSVFFWYEFLWGTPGVKGYRGSDGVDNGLGYMPGRVTDFTPEPFKALELPVANLLKARLDVRVQDYFGDMSPVDAWEAALDLLNGGFPAEAIRGFVDGGRKSPPPIFYQGRIVRRLQTGTCIWNANLLAEAGLI